MRRFATLAAIVIASLRCAVDDQAFAWSWSVDTVASIGVEAGDSNQEFVRLVAAQTDSARNIFLLDLLRPGIVVFDSAGRFLDATGVGGGPSELRQPRAMALSPEQQLLVVDPGNRRITRFEVTRGVLTLIGSMPLAHPASSICALPGHVYAGFLFNDSMAHELGPDGQILASFSPAPELPGLENLGAGGTVLTRRQILSGRLFCDGPHGLVLVAAASYPVLRAYTPGLALVWETRVQGVTPVGFRVEDDGSIVAEYDPDKGAYFVRSMVPWDDEHVLVQYEVRMPGDPAPQEFHEIDSRFISVVTGVEVGRTTTLPLLTTGTGDGRFMVLMNAPFPRALIVHRRNGPDRS